MANGLKEGGEPSAESGSRYAAGSPGPERDPACRAVKDPKQHSDETKARSEWSGWAGGTRRGSRAG